MQSRRIYGALLGAIIIAAGVLGYYTYQTASQYESLGARSIAQSLVLLVEQTIGRLEQQIINADNAVFDAVDLDEPKKMKFDLIETVAQDFPSVRSLLVLNDKGDLLAYQSRAGRQDSRKFLRLFHGTLSKQLDIKDAHNGRLKHLHTTVDGGNILLSYVWRTQHDIRYLLVVQHDVGYIVRESLPMLLKTNERGHLYNVVDENNRRVYGVSLTDAGVYVVGKRFPTTLYGWRLQAAPKHAPQLEAKGRSRRFNEAALIFLAFSVIFAGIVLLLYVVAQERTLNTRKTEFLANVSHELKTPLSVVRMFAELLLSGRVANPEKEQEYLEVIGKESERLSTLIENVLDFSAAESKKRKYDLIEGSIGETVSRAVEAFRHRVEREGKIIKVDIDPGISSVAFDEQAVVLAVINLLDNAAKYGGAEVTVGVKQKGKHVNIFVQDKGEGIPTGDLGKIFERFYRSRSHPHIRGSGIGLSLVRYIAEGHGGRVWAKNRAEGGAEVGFSLPAKGRVSGVMGMPVKGMSEA
ncbi:MAG: HAMP domain-containing histidine kinase [Myxococcales bacterium]|nr:HAMP domain-containing histidine kinase [Myxococcales bacterium]MCB9708091.1 HAMP domain-containing histidine kinase [Myxococcales bacterium]